MSFPTFIEALRAGSRYPHPCQAIRVLETHISWVLLTGPFAYKVKKPVNLGFLDYSTLERRHHFCLDELRINRRLAPHIYLSVAPITGAPDAPLMEGPGEAFEYAVKMRQFDQGDLLDTMLARGRVDPALLDTLADTIARFHEAIEHAPPNSRLGTPEVVKDAVEHNFQAIHSNLPIELMPPGLGDLLTWTRERWLTLAPTLRRRRREGKVRECHGDMHLGNIALVEDRVTIFDAIEFNEELRWIDIASEIAFITMDLDDRQTPGWSRRLLNRYLQQIGDYDGLWVLRYYQTYRALVRAKVAAIQAHQAQEPEERRNLARTCTEYVTLAEGYVDPPNPAVVISRGMSGSGKSTLARELIQHSDLIWIRSDVERKRLFGLQPTQRANTGLEAGIYSHRATIQTYERLLRLTRIIVEAGFPVLVDATFLDPARRARFLELAAGLGVPFRIMETTAPREVLRQRILARQTISADPSDAGPAVLKHQLAASNPLHPAERAHAIVVDTSHSIEPKTVLEKIGMIRIF